MVSAQGLGMADTLVEGIGIAGTPNGGVLTVQGSSAPTGDGMPATGVSESGLMLYSPQTGLWNRGRDDTPAAEPFAGTGLIAAGINLYDPATGLWSRARSSTADGQSNLGLFANNPMLINQFGAYDRARSTRDAVTNPGTNIGIPKVGNSRLTTYSLNARLAARLYDLIHVFGAAGRFQYLTLYHLATAVKTVRIKQVIAQMTLVSAAAHVTWDLSRLTAAVTPATFVRIFGPQAANSGAAAAEITVGAQPTVQGTEADATNVFASDNGVYGITGAGSVVNPPPQTPYRVLWPPAGSRDIELDDPLIRAGVAEGWAVICDVSVACTINATIQVVFTEE